MDNKNHANEPLSYFRLGSKTWHEIVEFFKCMLRDIKSGFIVGHFENESTYYITLIIR